LSDKFFAVSLSLNSSAYGSVALGTVAPKRDSVICKCSYSYVIKLIYYTRTFRNLTKMLGLSADVVLPKLS
jgi:hypothetical protein